MDLLVKLFFIVSASMVIAYIVSLEYRLAVIEDWIKRQKISRDHRHSKHIFEELEKR